MYHWLGYVVRPGMELGFFFFNRILKVPRPRVIILNDQGQALLVRHWGSRRHWSIPGGGAKHGEPVEQAARREVYEELGVLAPEHALAHVETVIVQYEAPIFVWQLAPAEQLHLVVDKREIVETGWYALEALPPHLTDVARLAFEGVVNRGRTNA